MTIRPRATGYQWPLRGGDTIDVTDREGRLLDTFEAAPVLRLIEQYVALRAAIMHSGPLKAAGRHLFAGVAVVPMLLRDAPRAWGPRVSNSVGLIAGGGRPHTRDGRGD